MNKDKEAKTGVYFEVKFDLKTLLTLLVVVAAFTAMYIDSSVQEEKFALLQDRVRSFSHDRYNLEQLMNRMDVEHKQRLEVLEKRLKVTR